MNTKQLIRAYLASTDAATAKQITRNIGLDNYPTDVIKALSEMRTDAEVECEKKAGKGNEYWYWLVQRGEVAADSAKSATCTNSQTDSITRRAPVRKVDEAKTVIPVMEQKQEVADVSLVSEGKMADLRAQLRLSEQQRNDHYDSAARFEAERNTAWEELKKIRGAIGADQDESTFDEVVALRAKLNEAAGENIRWLALAKEYGLDSIEGLRSMIDGMSRGFSRLALQLEQIEGDDIEHQVAQVMHERIHDKQRIADLEVAVDVAQQMNGDSKDVKDAAIGYLVRVPKRKPRLCMKPESAREAALSGARAHGRADVLALVPVGKAVRGAEWKEAS